MHTGELRTHTTAAVRMCAGRTCQNQRSMTFMGIVTPLTNDPPTAFYSGRYES